MYFWPFAAFFVLLPLLCLCGRAQGGAALCLAAGAAAGLVLLLGAQRGAERLQARYAGRSLRLTAEVQQVQPGFHPGVVRAVLWVETADGGEAGFRAECPSLPRCAAGDLVRGRFVLTAPGPGQALELYAGGAALYAEYQGGFALLGRSRSFRAQTARLQTRLSEALQTPHSPEVGGVLAAMIAGDRSALPAELSQAYRAAGLSHVLVVSGMHVTLLCGGVLQPGRPQGSRAVRRAGAMARALCALVLVGVTGFTPSVLRAAAAVWIGALGAWVYGAPDALTSLAAAGLLLSAANGYAACDVGFELSFAAVLGTLAGAACARRGQRAYRRAHPAPRSRLRRLARRAGGALWEGFCVSLGASAATFPVLVLRGLCASLYALPSNLAVLWLVQPLMVLGLAAALASLVPPLRPLYLLCSAGAGGLTAALNAWAGWVASWPGAQLWFDTAYAALVCLVVLGLGWLALRWRVRLRAALPALALVLAAALGVGSALSRDLIHVELAGGSNTPAVVISQAGRAIVLFRGGDAAQQAVEALLARRNIQAVELLVDLRLDPASPCTLAAEARLEAAACPPLASRTLRRTVAQVELLRTQDGCVVRVTAGGQTLGAVSGSAALARPVRVDWLLASPARPAALRCGGVLALRSRYSWAAQADGRALHIRPGGGVRLVS